MTFYSGTSNDKLLDFLRVKLLLVVFMCFLCPSFAKNNSDPIVSDPVLVSAFYKEIGSNRFWFPENDNGMLRRQLVSLLTNCDIQGLDPKHYSIEALQSHMMDNDTVGARQMLAEHLYTDVAIRYLKDLLSGNIYADMTPYDELSSKAKQQDENLIINLLAGCLDSSLLAKRSESLEPATEKYSLLKAALQEALPRNNSDTVRQLKIALNTYRWINHFHSGKCIVVNIASTQLRYYERDSLVLEMKVVVGKPSTPTPRFAAHCNQIILYPYWNVPYSIAVNELLPLCKKGPGVLNFMNMQVLDSKGNVMNPEHINWKAYSRKNFPFRFRQSTGCDNALGVVKLNLTSPYSVYLHDTNMKFAFKSNKRYMSHGCIRIEKPMELCRYLLGDMFNQQFVEACIRNQKPVIKPLSEPVPVFVIYVRADTEEGQVKLYPDIYHLTPKP